MDTIKSSADLLHAVRKTMDTIDIRGIENQDKFVGCANAVYTVAQTLEKFLNQSTTGTEPGKQEGMNGTG